MAKSDLQNYVIPTAKALADEMGYTLVDAELVKEGPGRYLRVYLDKDGGIELDDCERYHRAFQPKVERVDYDFLEVCSPGLDRPLKNDTDYERALGTTVEVSLFKPVEGKKRYEGELIAFDGETATLRIGEEKEVVLPRRGISLAKPVIEFDEGDFEE